MGRVARTAFFEISRERMRERCRRPSSRATPVRLPSPVRGVRGNPSVLRCPRRGSKPRRAGSPTGVLAARRRLRSTPWPPGPKPLRGRRPILLHPARPRRSSPPARLASPRSRRSPPSGTSNARLPADEKPRTPINEQARGRHELFSDIAHRSRKYPWQANLERQPSERAGGRTVAPAPAAAGRCRTPRNATNQPRRKLKRTKSDSKCGGSSSVLPCKRRRARHDTWPTVHARSARRALSGP